ncbi:MAG: hypothetical protein JWO38_7339 [Gemmataceae bacterium]|nr:hypothetical protein [Gemmataceae bacterium]
MADRAAIEQAFKDLKEVRWAGQQRVRNVYVSVGAFAVNVTLYSVVEASAWGGAEADLVDRSRSPWDAEDRRPSHADKRKGLQRRAPQAAISLLSRTAQRAVSLCTPPGSGHVFRRALTALSPRCWTNWTIKGQSVRPGRRATGHATPGGAATWLPGGMAQGGGQEVVGQAVCTDLVHRGRRRRPRIAPRGPGGTLTVTGF